jgi:response regulator RpfG family c-di-GMP phosphodiesterase
MNILVAEDTKMINLIVTRTLESLNHRVFSAFSGSEAINILEKEDVHFMILDHFLSDITAAEILFKIKDNRILSSIPVIILTASIDDTVKQDDYPSIVSILEKPISPEELKLKFNEIMEENLLGGRTVSDEEDEEFLNSLKEEYREEWLERVQYMFEALEDKDYQHLRMEAHALIGSGSTFGYNTITMIASNIQENIENRDDEAIKDDLHRIKDILE